MDTGTGLRYQDIANQIRARIAEGRFRYGDVLPSQATLAGEFSTTVMTVRQAIRLLEDEGLIESRHGVGSFVRGLSEDHRAFGLASFGGLFGDDRVELGTRIVSRDERAKDASAAVRFEHDPGISSLARVRTYSGAPIVYQVSFIRREYWSIIRDYDADASLYATLSSKLNTVISHARERIFSRLVPGDIAEYLGCSGNAPAFYSERTSMDAAGRTVLFDRAWVHGERIHLALSRTGRNADFRFVIDRKGVGE